MTMPYHKLAHLSTKTHAMGKLAARHGKNMTGSKSKDRAWFSILGLHCLCKVFNQAFKQGFVSLFGKYIYRKGFPHLNISHDD